MGLNMIVSKLRYYTQLHNIHQTFSWPTSNLRTNSEFFNALACNSSSDIPFKKCCNYAQNIFSNTHPIINRFVYIFQLLGNLQVGHLILDMWVNNTSNPNYNWLVIVSSTVDPNSDSHLASTCIFNHTLMRSLREFGICFTSLTSDLLAAVYLYFAFNHSATCFFNYTLPCVCYQRISFKLKYTWKTLK